MAEMLPTSMEVPVDSELECPACHQRISMTASVLVKRGSARSTGGTTFQTNFSVSVETQITKFVIHHECTPPPKGKS